MLIYLSVFLIAVLYLFYAEKKGKTQSKGLLFAFLMFLSIFIGLGDMIGGYDRYIYGEIFDSSADARIVGKSVNEVLNVPGAFSEKGYMMLGYLLSFITTNRYVYILLSTVVMYVMYYFVIKRYSINYPLACIIFLGFFYYFTITYLRQAMAVGIIWLSVQYIQKRHFLPFVVLVLLAYTFHNSALIFLPMYFIGSRRFSILSVFALLVVFFVLGFTSLPKMFIEYIGDTAEMEERVSHSASHWGDARIDYIIEVTFFLWVLVRNKNALPNDKSSLVFFNIFYAFCAILLLFMRMGQGGRFGWYYMIGVIYVLNHFVTYNQLIKDMKLFVVGLSFLLFYRVTNAWAFNLTPYKTFLTNGYPSGERYIYEKYEYDLKYTSNKFYRRAFILFGSSNDDNNSNIQ